MIPEIIRARAPLRLGLAGGGTDVSPYSDQYGGYVLNVTIDKYAYATIESGKSDVLGFISTDSNVQWSGRPTFPMPNIAGLELLIGVYNRIVLQFNNGHPLPITLSTFSEAPPGSGLGSSSALVVAIIKVFCDYLSLPLGEYDIAQLAYEIERIDLNLAGGKQDQYAAAFGGLNFMEFHENKVIVNPLRIRPDVRAELESSLVLFYSGLSRSSATIIEEQAQNVRIKNEKSLSALHSVKAEAVEMKNAILKADFDMFVTSMRAGWLSKKLMAKSITNPYIDAVYEKALGSGALAGRVSGAGGGGFMIFFVDLSKKSNLLQALRSESGWVMECKFSEEGAQSWRR